jgi:hypothetical protein
MNQKYVMFLGLILAAGTLISLTFGGVWLNDTDLTVINSLTVFKQANILNIWSITVPNIDFFIVGAKALVMFDFGFFGGPLQLIQWFLMLTVGLGFTWGVYTVCIYAMMGIFSRR